MQVPLNSSPKHTVELSEDEFNDVYVLLKTCIAAEMGLDDDSIPDGKEFINSCMNILGTSHASHSTTISDMQRGFIPLFERLFNAKDSPVSTEDGVVYRVTF